MYGFDLTPNGQAAAGSSASGSTDSLMGPPLPGREELAMSLATELMSSPDCRVM